MELKIRHAHVLEKNNLEKGKMSSVGNIEDLEAHEPSRDIQVVPASAWAEKVFDVVAKKVSLEPRNYDPDLVKYLDEMDVAKLKTIALNFCELHKRNVKNHEIFFATSVEENNPLIRAEKLLKDKEAKVFYPGHSFHNKKVLILKQGTEDKLGYLLTVLQDTCKNPASDPEWIFSGDLVPLASKSPISEPKSGPSDAVLHCPDAVLEGNKYGFLVSL